MRIEIIHIGNVLLCPPVINLVNMLEDLKIETELITTKSDFSVDSFSYIKLIKLPFDYENDRSLVKKITNLNKIKSKLWEILDRHKDDDTIIWITSNIDLKHLGNKITERKYILQMMELSEDLRYHKKLPLGLNAHSIGESASAVVVPEYNRAHIVKAWWNLSKTPFVLSNKPYNKKIYKKNENVSDDRAASIIRQIGNRKIILYQGIIHKERPLDKYIEAVNLLGDEYAFVVMSGGEDIYKDIKSNNYYFIPYIKAPQHLEVTSHAYIGVLSYFPTPSSDYSILNAVFCAPNKTYEYAMFGIPMIGNDNPGLNSIFSQYNCGICIKDFDAEHIAETIKMIENHYDMMQKGANRYYMGTDTLDELREILEEVWG